MFANDLVAYTSVIGIPKQYLNFLTRCITKSHLIPEYFVISPYASSLAMDMSNLKDFILVDIGAQTSDIIVFDSNGTVIWTGSVPLGGNNITQDICSCFELSFAEAEKIKILHGKLGRTKDLTATESQEGSTSRVDTAMLNKIITARVEEIIEMIMDAIPSDYRLSQFILTGGSATLTGMSDFVSETFNCQAEIINHTRSGIHSSNIKNDPAFSTSLGLIQYYIMASEKKNAFSISTILQNIWESF
jgi:cell division protein FtsA